MLLSVTGESPHRADSGCVPSFPCQHLLARGGTAMCVSLLQSTEAIAAAAGLSCFPLPASNQTRAQEQSCCGSRYRSETSWKRTVRKRAVPTQVVLHLRCVWDEEFLHLWSPHGNRFQLPGKLDNWKVEGHCIIFQALLMPSQETVTKYVILGIPVSQL